MDKILNWANDNKELLLKIFLFLFIGIIILNLMSFYIYAFDFGLNIIIGCIVLLLASVILFISYTDKKNKYNDIRTILIFTITILSVISIMKLQFDIMILKQ